MPPKHEDILKIIESAKSSTGKPAILQPYKDCDTLGQAEYAKTASNAMGCAATMIYRGTKEAYIKKFKDLYEPSDGSTPTITDLETYNFMKIAKSNLENGSADKFFLSLISCHQVKPLKSDNVTNFCNSIGLTTPPSNILRSLDFWAAMTPIIVTQSTFTELINQDLFLKYHTSACTTGNLCYMALESSPFDGFFSSDEVNVIKEAYERPYDITVARKIPDIVIVKASIWLDITDRLPSTWYMAKKAMGKSNYILVDQLTKNLKQAAKVLTKDYNPKDTDSLDTVKANLDAVLKGAHQAAAAASGNSI